MVDMDAVQAFAEKHRLWVIEDAAHAFPAAYRAAENEPWRCSGENTARVTCFSFYANKTMTTGEGGMAVTDDPDLADRMRCMSLHGLSLDAWDRFRTGASWDYKIVAPGYKYNMTDVAAAMGLHQLARAEAMRQQREAIAHYYIEQMVRMPQLKTPCECPNRLLSWHLFPVRLNLDRLEIDRNVFIENMGKRGIGTSVHWRPLHLHPYYVNQFGWTPEHLPVASQQWQQLVSLPIFPGMRSEEMAYVVEQVSEICETYGKEAP